MADVYSAIILDDDYWDGTESWAGETSQTNRDSKYSTRRFTSVNAWESDRDGNSSSGNTEYGIIIGSWVTEETPGSTLQISGWNADAIVLDCPLTLPDGNNLARHNGIYGDNSHAYRLRVNQANILRLSEDDIIVRGIQLYGTKSSSNQKGILAEGASNFTILIDSCIVKGDSNNSWAYNSGIAAYSSTHAGTLTVENCIIIDCVDDDNAGIQNYPGSGTINTNVYNSIITNCRWGVWNFNNTTVCKNSAVFNNYDDFKLDSGTLTIDYCASDDGDGTNAVDWDNEATDWAVNFNDYANDDFTPKNQDLPGAGVGPSTDGNVPTTDIIGNTRSGTACTIGAFQYMPKLSDGEDLSGIFTDDIQGQTRSIWYIGASELVSAAGIEIFRRRIEGY